MDTQIGTSYNLYAYGGMIGRNSRPRVQAFAQALQQAITPESVVIEIGCGPGFFALLACQFGARHVYAIEPNDSIVIAEELAQANGFADRITFYQQMSSEVELPEKGDVIVSDMRGALPWLGQHIPSIIDARERFLAPNGVLIPQRDTVWAAIVNTPKRYAPYTEPWDENEFNLDLSAARKRVINTHRKGHVEADDLLVPPKPWAELDYASITDTGAKGALEWIIKQPGTGHGLSAWFSTELLEGIGYSNAPDHDHIPIYSQVFFPWEQPVELTPGDRVQVTLQTNLADDNNVWRWGARITSGADATQTKAQFDQSDFFGQIRKR